MERIECASCCHGALTSAIERPISNNNKSSLSEQTQYEINSTLHIQFYGTSGRSWDREGSTFLFWLRLRLWSRAITRNHVLCQDGQKRNPAIILEILE